MLNQHLWSTPLPTPEDALRRLAAVQAQEFPVAKWSLAQRARNADNAAIDRSFADGAILRTHILRPTWHFVLPEDIRWMLELSGPRVNAMNSSRYRQLELDNRLLAKTNKLIAKALHGDNHLTRKELRIVLERAGLEVDTSRLAFIVMRAELDGVVCSGAPKGKQHTYALLDERAPEAKSLGRDGALAELTRRFFCARGPATIKDYAWWSSFIMSDVRKGLDMVKSELEHEVIEDRTYWFAPQASHKPGSKKVIDLVQGYDEYLMSYSESRDAVFAELEEAGSAYTATVLLHSILCDGQLIGHWRPVRKEGSVLIETSLYRPLSHSESEALETAVGRYGRFMGEPVTLI